MTRFEALNIIKDNLEQIDIKATQSNIRAISTIGSLVTALIDLENQEMKNAEANENEPSEEKTEPEE